MEAVVWPTSFGKATARFPGLRYREANGSPVQRCVVRSGRRPQRGWLQLSEATFGQGAGNSGGVNRAAVLRGRRLLPLRRPRSAPRIASLKAPWFWSSERTGRAKPSSGMASCATRRATRTTTVSLSTRDRFQRAERFLSDRSHLFGRKHRRRPNDRDRRLRSQSPGRGRAARWGRRRG